MGDVAVIPRIRCDNCGHMTDKESQGDKFIKPRLWGAMKAEGGRMNKQTYGTGKERIDFTDLCPECAEVALNVAADALKTRRGE